MKLKVFAIPATGDEAAEVALNTFTAKHRAYPWQTVVGRRVLVAFVNARGGF